MNSVLIVEDEQLMQDLLIEYFKDADYKVYSAGDGVEALSVFRSNDIDLVILDIMMPKLDGFSVCRKIRKESDALIIMLTAREDEDDKLLGFELGADEYVTKPFSPKVLVARAGRLLNRFRGAAEKETSSVRVIGDLEVDVEGYMVSLKGRALNLTNKEFELLRLLIENDRRVLNREMILEKVWGDDYFGDGRVVDTNIKTLRKKLGERAPWIRTVINVGYKFERNDEVDQ